MTEVKRYHLTETGLVEGESLGRLSVVLAADFDRVTAERDALRNEVGQVKGEYDRAVNKVDALQQRLTAADERADVLEGLLDEFEAMQVCDARIRGTMPARWQELIVRKRAALKPAGPHPCPISLDGCDGSCAP